MAFPTIDEKYLEENWHHEEKKNVATKAQEIITGTLTKAQGIFTGFTDFTMVFLYFLMTGLAILFRSPIPKEWMALSKKIGGKRISKIIENQKEKIEKIKPKRRFKVVDTDTKRPFKVMKSVK